MKVKVGETIAAIDVGSTYLRMTIEELNKEGIVKVLENVIKPTEIGKDTFTSGRISVKTIHETCDSLRGFVHLMKDYRVKDYKAVSTSGIREAENKQYILEQIRLRTGLNVESINTAQECFFMSQAVRNNLSRMKLNKLDDVLIINITSGAVEASIYKDGRLKFNEHVNVGALRLREKLMDLEEKTIDFPDIMEQYIESKIYSLKNIISTHEIKYFVGLGGELSTIMKIEKNKSKSNHIKAFMSKEKFMELYLEIRNMTDEQMKFTYGISQKKAELLIPSILIFYCFLKMTKANGIYTPLLSLREGILCNLLNESIYIHQKEEALKDIISSVWCIGEKYGIDKKHAAFVEKISLSIFDQSARFHKLGLKERMYLQVAAILHDSGNIINVNDHNIHSQDVIRTQSIMGFSNEEIEIIANIARYHSEEIPKASHSNYNILNSKNKMVVSTLAAILKLAEALDVTHLQKVKELKLSAAGEMLFFNLQGDDDIILEEWNFMKNSNFFEEVVGIKPVI